jgi:hypothetical protein
MNDERGVERADGQDEARPAINSPSRSAERMREHRQRSRKGIRYVNIQLHITEIAVLVQKGYLPDADRSDLKALRSAVETFINDHLFGRSDA